MTYLVFLMDIFCQSDLHYQVLLLSDNEIPDKI